MCTASGEGLLPALQMVLSGVITWQRTERKQVASPLFLSELAEALLPGSSDLPDCPALNADVDFGGHKHAVCHLITDHQRAPL